MWIIFSMLSNKIKANTCLACWISFPFFSHYYIVRYIINNISLKFNFFNAKKKTRFLSVHTTWPFSSIGEILNEIFGKGIPWAYGPSSNCIWTPYVYLSIEKYPSRDKFTPTFGSGIFISSRLFPLYVPTFSAWQWDKTLMTHQGDQEGKMV
jgi:hypothetical protein